MNNIKWIYDKNTDYGEWRILKQSLTLDCIDDIYADISALGRYFFYINGAFVARGPHTSFDFNKLYDSIDISQFLKKGKNELTILSQHTTSGGVYINIYNEHETLCISDESRKIKPYTALCENALPTSPPLSR